MSLRWMFVSSLALGLACAGAAAPEEVRAPPPQPAVGPAEVIRELYAPYAADGPTVTPSWLPFASEDLARSWRIAVEESRDGCGVPAIHGSDPVVDAQDFGRIEQVQVDVRPVGGGAAATASFVNFGKPKTVRFDLVREGGSWRIDDVHPSGDSLRKRIRDTVVAGDGC